MLTETEKMELRSLRECVAYDRSMGGSAVERLVELERKDAVAHPTCHNCGSDNLACDDCGYLGVLGKHMVCKTCDKFRAVEPGKMIKKQEICQGHATRLRPRRAGARRQAVYPYLNLRKTFRSVNANHARNQMRSWLRTTFHIVPPLKELTVIKLVGNGRKPEPDTKARDIGTTTSYTVGKETTVTVDTRTRKVLRTKVGSIVLE